MKLDCLLNPGCVNHWVMLSKLSNISVLQAVCMLSHFSHVRLCATVIFSSLSAFSDRGILQARILELVAMFSSRGSSQSRDPTSIFCISCTAGGFFTTEPPGKACTSIYSSVNWDNNSIYFTELLWGYNGLQDANYLE